MCRCLAKLIFSVQDMHRTCHSTNNTALNSTSVAICNVKKGDPGGWFGLIPAI